MKPLLSIISLALLLFFSCDDSTAERAADSTHDNDEVEISGPADISDQPNTEDLSQSDLKPSDDLRSDLADKDADKDQAQDQDLGQELQEDTEAPLGFSTCLNGSFTLPPQEEFRHTGSELLVSISSPGHSAQDVLSHPGEIATIPGKFAYGAISKDLEDEDILTYLFDCHQWRSLGRTTTDSDGRTETPLPTDNVAGLALHAGAYDLKQVVLGDLSIAPSRLFLLPEGTEVIVFDIDGTLTTSDSEVFQDAIDELYIPIYEGEYVPEAYPDALNLTKSWADKGYIPIYLTGRPYWLTSITRGWLDELGFPLGLLHVTNSNSEVLPTEGGVGEYKRDYLQYLQSMGLKIVYAYGNATTDIYAYEQAGIPKEDTFIIGEKGGEEGTQDLGEVGYSEHLSFVEQAPDANQPF